MYKNFNITESEKKQILNRLQENGYGLPKHVRFNGPRFSEKTMEINHVKVYTDGDKIVYTNKRPENEKSGKKRYGIYSIEMGDWIEGYEPMFHQGSIDLYSSASNERKFFLLEEYRNKDGNVFYILVDVDTDDNVNFNGPVVKIFAQGEFDEVMKDLKLVEDGEDDKKEKYQGGPDPVYTDSVYEEDVPLNEGKQILINTYKKLIK